MQQGSTAGDIIERIEVEADEKPYDLSEFAIDTMTTIVGTTVGNPTSSVFTAPLGLLKITPIGAGSGVVGGLEIEVVGVTEL